MFVGQAGVMHRSQVRSQVLPGPKVGHTSVGKPVAPWTWAKVGACKERRVSRFSCSFRGLFFTGVSFEGSCGWDVSDGRHFATA